MSAFNNQNNFTDPYNTNMFNLPQLLRDSSFQVQYLQETEDLFLGKHERGFFEDEDMDIDSLREQSAYKRIRYSDEHYLQG